MLTLIEELNLINIPPLRKCGEILKKNERLKTYFYKLQIAKPCNSNEDALGLINSILVEVEDCHSGLSAKKMPGLKYSGRMYPVQDDFIIRENGKIIARSKGNEIIIENDGDFVIFDRYTREIIISKIK
ncbi:hypothetical protein FY557_04295 [Chryseobacterium sp. SN22]|uniref:hypothetical protein n=1 Tax=Chryseobacterium sp. SN22 TaxID=2606431 RepID=UPI0011EDE141|nr:hypothetical protein [Chryseobacterium sp. SN22]KAA0129527.1 hypothetical protein FY557_04295 [Chryseobacterium sp. SN22]